MFFASSMGSSSTLMLSYLGVPFLFLLILSSISKLVDAQPQAPDSCGQIRNITCPFRLQGDRQESCPQESTCELSCEDTNNTILIWRNHKFYVQAINYDNFTIRVRDAGTNKSNFSTAPANSLAVPFEDGWEKQLLRPVTDYSQTSQVMFMSCDAPLDNASSFNYSEITDRPGQVSSVVNNTAGLSWTYSGCGSSYFSVNGVLSLPGVVTIDDELSLTRPHGYILVSRQWSSSLRRIPRTCGMDVSSLISRWPSNMTISGVYEELYYGFELSFLPLACEEIAECCRKYKHVYYFDKV